jgi:hypothetical protein
VSSLLTFDVAPTGADLAARASELAAMAVNAGAEAAMIGGAPYFMAPLEKALRAAGVTPCTRSRRVKASTRPSRMGLSAKWRSSATPDGSKPPRPRLISLHVGRNNRYATCTRLVGTFLVLSFHNIYITFSFIHTNLTYARNMWIYGSGG